MEWWERAREAERLRDWGTAIALVSAHADCYSADHQLHDNHLWHLELLARAGRFAERTERARTDVHARRRLNRALREQGMESALRGRAHAGDRDALYVLVRLLGETNRAREAHRAVRDLGPADP
ncbi:hypothetical protein RM844_14360 [Streptomyces sp. DSM 44915]|uniref:Uncharacterized protein n=1 Tax=Streptomyces chisholmiae TaxID=3075540 RepID=A0ABU2JRW5_9ACTN|nr:hypothetical protein [Streptomyces sp. DSM 44915]MDT0267471.1 hypothetical protein [Streptomyces sp. DSM 44915]